MGRYGTVSHGKPVQSPLSFFQGVEGSERSVNHQECDTGVEVSPITKNITII